MQDDLELELYGAVSSLKRQHRETVDWLDEWFRRAAAHRFEEQHAQQLADRLTEDEETMSTRRQEIEGCLERLVDGGAIETVIFGDRVKSRG